MPDTAGLTDVPFVSSDRSLGLTSRPRRLLSLDGTADLRLAPDSTEVLVKRLAAQATERWVS